VKLSHLLLIVLVSAVTAFAVTTYIVVERAEPKAQTAVAAAKETRLDAVKKSGVIRCGYIVWPPFLTRDPNTGKFGGMTYDLVEEIGRQLHLKIEWTGEIAMGQMLADLALNRYDMICDPFVETPGRAREGDFTLPLFYAPVYLYVRKDDTRFDNDYARADRPDIKFAALDGEYSAIAANDDFPDAAKLSLPQMSSAVDLFMSVAGKKADVVVEDPYAFSDYSAGNPGLLRPAAGSPLHVTATSMPIPANEPGFKDMIDHAVAYLQDSGFTDKVLDKYEGSVKFIRPAKAYREPAAP